MTDLDEKFIRIEDENKAVVNQVVRGAEDVVEDCRVKLLRTEAHTSPYVGN